MGCGGYPGAVRGAPPWDGAERAALSDDCNDAKTMCDAALCMRGSPVEHYYTYRAPQYSLAFSSCPPSRPLTRPSPSLPWPRPTRPPCRHIAAPGPSASSSPARACYP